MGLKRWVFVSALTAFLASAGAGYPRESDIIKDFSEALRAGDRAAMLAIIKENKDKIPTAIEGILEEAYEAPSQEKESLLYMVEVKASSKRPMKPRARRKRVFCIWSRSWHRYIRTFSGTSNSSSGQRKISLRPG
jgi:hypothetical protein